MGKIIGIIFGKKNTPWQRIDEAGNSINVVPGYFDEHPAYEQYLSLCILADLQTRVRSDLAARVKESRQQ